MKGRTARKKNNLSSTDTPSNETAMPLLEINRILRDVIHSISDLFLIVDRKWNIMYLSEECARIYGIKPPEAIGKNIWGILKQTKGTILEANFRKAMDGHKTISFEYKVPTDQLWHDIITYPTRDGIAVCCRDITEKKESEELRKESEKKLRAFLEAIRYGVLIIDLTNKKYIECNSALSEMTGYTKDEIKGKTIGFLTPVDNMHANLMHYRDFEFMKYIQVETEIRTKDGRKIPVEVSSSCVELGGIKYDFAILIDITERRKILEAQQKSVIELEHSIAQYRAVVDNLSEGVVIAKLDETLYHWNRAALRMHGFHTLQECQKKLPYFAEIFELYEMDGRKLSVADWPLSRILRGEVMSDWEIKIRRKGSLWQRIFSYSGQLVRDGTDPFLAVITVRDITEPKIFQEELSKKEVALRTIINSMPALVVKYDPKANVLFLNEEFKRVMGWTEEDAEKHGIMNLVYPDRKLRKEVQEYMDRIGSEWKEFPCMTKTKKIIPVSWSNTLLEDGTLVGIGIDMSEIRRAEHALLRSNSRNEILSEVAGSLLASDRPLENVYRLCRKTMKFLGCDIFINFVADPDGGMLHLNAYSGIPKSEAKKIESIPIGTAICGCVAQAGKRIVAEDIQKSADPMVKLVKTYGMNSYACHPLMAEGKVIGTLSFGSKKKTAFSDEELSMMKAVSDHISIAMERIRANNRIIESEEKYRNLVDNSVAGIYRSTLGGRILYANRALLDFFGYASLEEMQNTNVQSYYADIMKRESFINELKKKKVLVRYGETFRTKEGKIRYALEGAFLEDGNISGMIIDITDTYLLQEKLEKSEKRYRELIDSANSIIINWSTDGKITSINPYGLSFFGYRREEIIGRHVMMLVPEADSEGNDLSRLAENIVANPEKYRNNENENIRKNGERVWISWTNRAVADEHGNVKGVIAIGNDITGVKRLQSELMKINDLKSSILRDVSHDLKHPISTIRLATDEIQSELLKKNLSREKLMKYAGIIDRNTSEFDERLNSVLEYSRLGLISEISKEEIDLNQLIANIIEKFREAAGSKGINLRLCLRDAPSLTANREMIESLIKNLVANAVKYTVRGYVRVETDARDGELEIRIKDSGVGIGKEHMAKLFEPYFKINPKSDGIGVGLAICRRIAELHYGKIIVASKPGKGSVFKVILPRK